MQSLVTSGVGSRPDRAQKRATASAFDEWRHGELDLRLDPERLSARDEQCQSRALREQSAELRCRLDDLLEVVQHDQQTLRADVLVEVASGGEGLGDRADDELGVA